MDDEEDKVDNSYNDLYPEGSITIDAGEGLSVADYSILGGSTIDYGSVTISQPYEYTDHEMTVKGDLVVEDPDTGEKTNISEFIKTVKERLSILEPKPEHLEKYEALRDLYEQYKMMEKLLTSGTNNAKED